MAANNAPAIIAPRSDLLLSGGLSIIVLIGLSILGLLGVSDLLLQNFLLATILINGTHFMASYRLLYSSVQNANRYPWASYYVPGLLLIYTIISISLVPHYPNTIVLLHILTSVSSLYLALHYTGQCWGMVSSFAFLDGIKLEPNEKQILRRTITFMAAWHFVWALKLLWRPPPEFGAALALIDLTMNALAVVAFIVGIMCFRRITMRIGRPVPPRVVTPYVALFVWYGCLFIFPPALFWVQIFHALQYLPFPIRVEVNRFSPYGQGHSALAQTSLYLMTLVITSALVFGILPHIADTIGPGAYNVWVALASIINIHHYYIDGCIWRISNPVVSKELFSHTVAH